MNRNGGEIVTSFVLFLAVYASSIIIQQGSLYLTGMLFLLPLLDLEQKDDS
jgi:hypothetical protein